MRKMMLLLAALLLTAAACGDDSGTGTESDTGDTQGGETTSTVAATTASTAAPTTTTTMAPTTTEAIEFVAQADAAGDCRSVATGDLAPQCMPVSLDLVSMEMTRASPFTVVIELAPPGMPELGPNYHFNIALDLDQDIATGMTDFGWPENHAMAPDLESDRFATGDDLFIQAYSITGQNEFEMLDPPPVTWTWLDDTHMEVVFDEMYVDAASFGVTVNLFVNDYFDTIVDGGHVVFPTGEVVLAP